MERQPETRRQVEEREREEETTNKLSRVAESDTEGLPSSNEMPAGATELARRGTQNENQPVLVDQHKTLRRHQPGAEEQVVSQGDNGRGGAPAVRLDMDLDVDVQLKAKIKGDITLSIL